ncbi:MAG: hypothetical protein ACXAEU_21465 [Candidatus Hodarchaeales archaeon]
MDNNQDMLNFVAKFEEIHPEDFSRLFILVQKIIKRLLNKTRPGILLGLVEMGFDRGNFIGGLHYGGTNEIYLNKSALRVMREESSPELYKAYVFYLLLHEYIHSVGVMDERMTRFYTRNVLQRVFENDHPLSKLATRGLNTFFPYTFNQRTYRPSEMEIYNPEYIIIRHPESEWTYN